MEEGQIISKMYQFFMSKSALGGRRSNLINWANLSNFTLFFYFVASIVERRGAQLSILAFLRMCLCLIGRLVDWPLIGQYLNNILSNTTKLKQLDSLLQEVMAWVIIQNSYVIL